MINPVSDEVKTQTTKCEHNYSCLETGLRNDFPLCKVEQRDGTNVLFLETTERTICPYRLDFGGKQLCTCPVHYHIHSAAAH